ncbi:MAG: HlyD family efflux transporter periplasmic adaptor subunit [Proteobacteria bacterium]|nr:HlyD family efflux transporter periplasmic adaptor subunit [Pseudomonadota bacterium]MBQ9243203.1 HlyD family efflux transporter periplasmic adaptor subunit [Pseudomonadota bacterium]
MRIFSRYIVMAMVALMPLVNACDNRDEVYAKLTTTNRGSDALQITGLINATEIDVASKVPGRISKINVVEGQQVKAGDELCELNLAELDAKLLQANSAIDAAKAQLALARKGARPQEKKAAANQVETARAQVEVTKKMLDRMQKLLDEKALPLAKFEEVEFKYQASVNQLAMAEAKLDAINKGARDEELSALEALVNRGESAAAEIEIYKSERVQVAPVDGEVSKIVVHEGELTNTGYPIITIVKTDDMWASFAVREDRLKDIRIGSKVEIEIPALDKKIPMVVSNISAMADFATWRATSDRDRFDLKSFEVKLRPESPIDGLRPGMTARW